MSISRFHGTLFIALLAFTGCSVEDKEQNMSEEGMGDALAHDDNAEGIDLAHCKKHGHGKQKKPKKPKKPKHPKNPEAGESAECTALKQNLANQGIFIHSSGLRVRFINMRLSYNDAQVACANSSGVLTLKPATIDQLELLTDLFVTDESEECKTDVWAQKSVKKGVRVLMPDVTTLNDGKDAKVICVVQE
ncbi:MAG: hypothetical protein AB7T49_14080 [Oligoflexales bacterium]